MHEEDLSNLEDLLRRLKVEYDIFFNGNRKRPPDDLRARLEKLVKRLSQVTTMTYSERFQFNTLVARFSLYRDVWRRMTAKQELGIEREAQALVNKRASGSEPVVQNVSPEEFRICIEDAESQQERIRELYDALVRLNGKQAKETPQISFKRFSSYVAAQTQSIRQRYDCPGVIFTLALEENAIKFRAVAADTDKISEGQ